MSGRVEKAKRKAIKLVERGPLKPRGFASPAQKAMRSKMLAGREISPTGNAGSTVAEVPAPLAVVPDPPPTPVPENAVTTEVAQAIENFARWRVHPWEYVREVLGGEPDFWQMDALIELGKAVQGVPGAYRKFCLKACKGPGKSCLLAWVILWFMTCFEHPKILVTSVTEDNLQDNLWAEISVWLNKSPMLMALFQKDASRMYARDHKETWFCSVRTWPKEADKTKQAATLAGLHGKNTMIVIDESGTIPIAVLSAAIAHHSTFDPTGKTEEIHLTLQAGNPDTLDGCLGWACTQDAANWWVKEITGDPDDPKRAPRISVEWAREMIKTYGRDNPWVLVNVFGKFPPVGSNKLLGPDIVRLAMEIWVPDDAWMKYARVMALDVARSTARDRSALCRRQGAVIFPFIKYRIDDANELAGQVAFEFSRWPATAIFVDATGLGGPVADHLRAIGLPVIMFYGGQPARDKRFVDRRTEVAWVCAQEIKGTSGQPALSLPKDMDLVSEACAPNIEWNGKGQMKLESKEKMLARGVGSPDVFDSLCMTFAEPVMAPAVVPASTLVAIRENANMVTEYDPYKE